MDLWIRTQNKERLLKVNKIEYEYYKPFWSDYHIHVIKLNDSIIQEYKTKERALEVLNEIQGTITSNECLRAMVPNLSNIKGEEEKIGELFRKMIYEMPEE